MAYHLDLAGLQALHGVYNLFHVLLLHNWKSNSLHTEVPPIQVDGEDKYEVLGIKGHK